MDSAKKKKINKMKHNTREYINIGKSKIEKVRKQ